MTEPTLRRRRRQTPSGSTTESIQNESTNETTAQQQTTSQSPRHRKSVEELVEGEEKAFSQFLSLFGLVAMIFLYMIRSTDFPPPRRVYAVMIDAGSMGTRAQVFKFLHDERQNKLVLNGSEMHKISKSIASLGSGIGGTGAQFFRPLLDKVKKDVPGVRRRQRTPIVMRATAGLRLLGNDAADRALQEARKALNASEFYFQEDFVSILDAKDEGVFAWTTVNYLLGNFDSPKGEHPAASPVATLELGGGSMQIVHTIEKTASDENDPDTHDLTIFGHEYTIRAVSHLGLGLIDFKKRLYQVFDWEGVLEEGNPCFRKGKSISEKSLRLGVAGSDEVRVVSLVGDGDFNRCVASAEIAIASFLKSDAGIGHLPPESLAYAFAFFFSRTVGFGLPKKSTKDQLIAKGKELCEMNSAKFSQAKFDEACVEFSYVFAVLKMVTKHFSADHGVSVHFEKLVDGHVLGWALGATLDIIEPLVQPQIALDKEPLTIG